MTARIASLFGFAPHEVQAAGPPLFAYILAIPVAIFAGTVIEWTTYFAEWASFGYFTRWWISVVFRASGVLCTLMVVHAFYRALIHQDDLSWGGWIRKRLLG